MGKIWSSAFLLHSPTVALQPAAFLLPAQNFRSASLNGAQAFELQATTLLAHLGSILSKK
jgi:hypothetical protein